MFTACHAAVRTEVGAPIAELLLPLLVLDTLCFGDAARDQSAVVNEMKDALSFGSVEFKSEMSIVDRQKAVRVVIRLLNVLQTWMVQEVEQNHSKKLRQDSMDVDSPTRSAMLESGENWPIDTSLMCIEDTLKDIPLSLRSQAALQVGMYAQALQFVEMDAREQHAPYVYGGRSRSSEANNPEFRQSNCALRGEQKRQAKDILSVLKDYDTMSALADEMVGTSAIEQLRDSIRLKEAIGDWEGAVQDYERASQLCSTEVEKVEFLRGSMRCMLALGQFER
jgi:hypothetical protein